jgi:hypothetical protein
MKFEIMHMPTIDELRAAVNATQYGKPVVANHFRGPLLEELVAFALCPAGWRRTAVDWGGWDFEDDGTQIEVKQTAARQTWDATRTIDRKSRFDIAPRSYQIDSTGWVKLPEPRRLANLYIFAHHPVIDDTVDHRDPAQWRFYVVPTAKLPDTQTISLVKLQCLAEPVAFAELAAQVAAVKATLHAIG